MTFLLACAVTLNMCLLFIVCALTLNYSTIWQPDINKNSVSETERFYSTSNNANDNKQNI